MISRKSLWENRWSPFVVLFDEKNVGFEKTRLWLKIKGLAMVWIRRFDFS